MIALLVLAGPSATPLNGRDIADETEQDAEKTPQRQVRARLRPGPLPAFLHSAHFRYDVIWLDLEHRAMGQREVQSTLAMCQQHDIDCMVRPPTQERVRLYRYLEDGATGFMIPFVSNADIARHIVECVILRYTTRMIQRRFSISQATKYLGTRMKSPTLIPVYEGDCECT